MINAINRIFLRHFPCFLEHLSPLSSNKLLNTNGVV